MATRRRDISPKKNKTGTSLNRPTATRTSNQSSARTPLHPILRTSTDEPRKQMIKKPTTTGSTPRRTLDKTPTARVPTKPSPQPSQTTTLSARKAPGSTTPSLPSRVKTPLPVQKTQVSTSTPLQSRDKTAPPARKTSEKTPLPVRKTAVPVPKKSIAPQKTGLDKKAKAVNVSLHKTPVSTTSKMSEKKTENENIAALTTKEQTTCAVPEKDESLSMYQNLPEAETVLLEDQEMDNFFLNQETQTEEVVEDKHVTKADSGQEKPLEIAEIEAENHDEVAKIVTMIEPEEKELVEEKIEEHSVIVASDHHKKEDEEKVEVVEMVEVVENEEEKEKVLDKNNEFATESEVKEPVETKEVETVEEHNQKSESNETKEAEIVEEQNQKSEPIETKEAEKVEEQNQKSESKVQKQVFPKRKENAVSNDAIEETANKLREQRKNRVRALAGAFESVMN